MPTKLPEIRASSRGWVERTILALDAWLRRRQGVFEFTDVDDCVFRLQRARAEQPLRLADGTEISPGDPILTLHFWNEHMPALGRRGASVAWGREFGRRIEVSLAGLAEYLASRREFDAVTALWGDLSLGPPEKSNQIIWLSRRYGFEQSSVRQGPHASMLRRLGENAHMFLLTLACNPPAARATVFRREHVPVYLSRAALKERYTRQRRIR